MEHLASACGSNTAGLNHVEETANNCKTIQACKDFTLVLHRCSIECQPRWQATYIHVGTLGLWPSSSQPWPTCRGGTSASRAKRQLVT